jgi:hypothetical protein
MIKSFIVNASSERKSLVQRIKECHSCIGYLFNGRHDIQQKDNQQNDNQQNDNQQNDNQQNDNQQNDIRLNEVSLFGTRMFLQ